ncbi:hypothetical protein Y032_1351g3843 [Ancylostoma ceylanicum]|uniref:Uncharacterized protein n=1 Tax=Ancylostoma ceylanicum TaxID=53326 RepID=A0A016W756_9BILA|nr:hypothetical protein Y032_1351g3843 [Ancylostoma ceylanicum]
MQRIPPPSPLWSLSAPDAVNRNLDEPVYYSPAPTEIAAPLRAVEESVANRDVHDETHDREEEPQIAELQEVHSDAICEVMEPFEDYFARTPQKNRISIM